MVPNRDTGLDVDAGGPISATCDYASMLRSHKLTQLARGDSDTCLQLPGAGFTADVPLSARPCADGLAQQFEVVLDEATCSYRVRAQWPRGAATYRCVAPEDSDVKLVECSRDDTLWSLTALSGNDTYRLEADGRCLTLSETDPLAATAAPCANSDVPSQSLALAGLALAEPTEVSPSPTPALVQVNIGSGTGMPLASPVFATGLVPEGEGLMTRYRDARSDFEARFDIRVDKAGHYIVSVQAALGLSRGSVEVALDGTRVGRLALDQTDSLSVAARSRPARLFLDEGLHSLTVTNAGKTPFALYAVDLWPTMDDVAKLGETVSVGAGETTVDIGAVSALWRVFYSGPDNPRESFQCVKTYCFVEYTLVVPVAGDYAIELGYFTGDADTSIQLFQDDALVSAVMLPVVGATTASWTQPIILSLREGANRVRLQHGGRYFGPLSGRYELTAVRIAADPNTN